MPRSKRTINGKTVIEESKTDRETGKEVHPPAKPKAQNTNKTAGGEQLYDERD
jgi:hypothetical protein